MKNTWKVGFLQFDVCHDMEKNLDTLTHCLEQNPCDLLVLPELSMCGYLFESREVLQSFAQQVPEGTATQRILALSKQYSCGILFGLAEKENDLIFNTAVFVSNGNYIGKYRKIHLSDFEKKLFDRGWENGIFCVDGCKIGVQICFDLWFPELSREQIRMGADLLCVLANFGGETTHQIAHVRFIENVTPVLLCNRIGAESIPGMDAQFLGKSAVIGAFGESLCQAPAKAAYFGAYELTLPVKKANVICGDFLQEMKLHY